MASEVSSGTTTNQGGEEETRLKLPPGFRFYPSDEELISHYLTHKALNSIFSCPVIADVDLNNIESWDLPSKAKMGEKEWYFFSYKDRKYPTGMRTNCATASGYWKVTGKDKEIFRGHRVLVGMKKTDGRIAAKDGRLGEGDQDEPDQFRCSRFIIPAFPVRRRLLLELWKNQWDSAHDDDGFNMTTTEEKDALHCSVRAPKPSVRYSTSDVPRNKMPWATRLEIMQGIASALAHLHSSWGRYSIHHGDLKPDNIVLDEKTENQLSDFGMSRLLHANDYTHIPMGRAVPTHNGPLDAKFSGKPSAKRCNEIKIGSHMTHLLRYLSVHHHPLIQMLPSARKWSGDIFTSCARLITSKRTFGIAEAGWVSAKPKYETPHAGPVSEYIIRKLFGIRNGLTVNESQQHSGPDSCPANDGKMAVNTKASASWIIATAAPHHATGNRNLLSGFIMEHDDQFVHAVNRVPMKVLARGAVVTDALILPDVWFVPGLAENLVSVSQLAELDHSIRFGRGECCIRSAHDAKIVGKGRLQKGGHYVLDYLKVPFAI